MIITIRLNLSEAEFVRLGLKDLNEAYQRRLIKNYDNPSAIITDEEYGQLINENESIITKIDQQITEQMKGA